MAAKRHKRVEHQSNPSPAPAQGRPAGSFLFQLLGLFVFILAVFYPALKIPFLLDDYQIYLDHWPSVSWNSFTFDVLHHFQQNRMLTHASWYLQMLMHAPAASSPYWFHWVNLAMHWANAALVFAFVRAIGASNPVSFLTSAFFAVHPGNMEAVAYVYGRSDLQVTAFLLSGLIFLKDGPRRLWLSGVCMAGAVLTKETAVVIPALYLAVAALLRPTAYPFSKTALALAVVAALASSAGFMFLKTDHADNFGYGFPNAAKYLMLQPLCLMIGLVRIIAPFGYSIVYHFDLPKHIWDFRVAGPILFWVGLLFFCVSQYKNNRPVYLFAAAWYLCAMAPTNSVVPRIDQLSDRHLYLALIGPFWAGAYALEQAWLRHGAWVRNLSWTAVAIFGALTFAQNVRWQSAETVWKTASERFPNTPLARRELAAEYGRAGDALKELEILESVTRRWPDDWTSWNNLGVAYAAQNLREKEQNAYRLAVPFSPRRHIPLLYHNLGFSYQNDNSPDSAVDAYRRAISLDPNFIDSKHNLAILLWQRGETAEAERHLREILESAPRHPTAKRNLDLMLKNFK